MTAEWLALAYFAYLALVARVKGHLTAWRACLTASIVVAAIVLVLELLPQTPTVRLLRGTWPLALLLAGYRLSGLFFVRPMRQLEAWLLHLDRRVFAWLGLGPARARRGSVVAGFELAYLFVYLLIPIGALTLAMGGWMQVVDRFWAIVLLSGFACYGMLPWIQTRPPRVLESASGPSVRPNADREPSRSRVADEGPLRRLNLFILSHGSIQVNTLPSGHAATVLATALVVAERMPAAGFVLLLAATAAILATVAGRYHYTLDSVLGALVAVAVYFGSRVPAFAG
jgi:PAP2 superfamily